MRRKHWQRNKPQARFGRHPHSGSSGEIQQPVGFRDIIAADVRIFQTEVLSLALGLVMMPAKSSEDLYQSIFLLPTKSHLIRRHRQ
jgi:hypothetical protein